MASPLGIRFWGTRGLVSTPGKECAKYGGNTACAQILHGDHIIVIDAGFGIANLGEQLQGKLNQRPIHILFTHMHWDHIQGLPFFHPIYFADSEIHLYSPMPSVQLHQNLDILFDGSYSPFEGIDRMPSKISFHQMQDTLVLPDGLTVTAAPANHGHEHNQHGKTWAYKFAVRDHALAFVTDHEADPPSANRPIIELCRGVDLLVHDAQYSDTEYVAHRGWGHSTPRMAVNNAIVCGARELLMTHHHPSRTDVQLDVMARNLRNETVHTDFAREAHDYWIVKSQIKKGAG
jgi:phosphoribosyl 1,2-cyclic phosphodiesterase